MITLGSKRDPAPLVPALRLGQRTVEVAGQCQRKTANHPGPLVAVRVCPRHPVQLRDRVRRPIDREQSLGADQPLSVSDPRRVADLGRRAGGDTVKEQRQVVRGGGEQQPSQADFRGRLLQQRGRAGTQR